MPSAQEKPTTQALQALHELAEAALRGPADEQTLTLAAAIIRRTTGARRVLLIHARDQDFVACDDGGDGPHLELSQRALWILKRQMLHFTGAAAFNLASHRVEDFVGISEEHQREFLAFLIPTRESRSEMCILQGPWKKRARSDALQFMNSALPALAVLLGRFLDFVESGQTRRHKQELNVLAEAAQVLTRSSDMEAPLTEIASAIATSTGFDFVAIDVYDEATAHFTARVSSETRWADAALSRFWKATFRPDDPGETYTAVVASRQPMLLPDMQNDERIAEARREFYRQSQLTSAALLPMFFQDELMGVASFTSHEPRSFPEAEVALLHGLATELATSLKAMQTYQELAESRERLRRYANRIERQQAALRQQAKKLRELASTDALTGVRNYGDLHDAADRLLARAQHDGAPLAMILADVDDFKLYNDTYGHLAGDKALKIISGVLSKACRPTDIVGRYGGDEFMLILPETDERGALKVAERLLERVAQTQFRPEPGAEDIPLHLAIGIAVHPEDGSSKDELIAHADAAMYESKARPALDGKITVSHEEGTDADLLRYPTSAFGVLHGLVRTVDRKDHYTKRHSEREAEYAVLMGAALNLSNQSQRALRIAGLLHDLGKIGIPDHLLRKPGPLTDSEREVMRQHVLLTERIVGGVPQIADVLAAASNHHERYDGGGYPRGLKGEQIPLLGRILAVADAFSAMTMDRPYRKAMSWSAAIEELRRNAGTQFDPELVEVFINDVIPQMDEHKAKAA